MKRRKGLAFILALSLVLSSFSVAFATDVAEETTPVTETTTEAVAPVATATNTAFADIAGHWAKDAIVKWADYGVVKGSDGVFRPDAPLTRAEMATVLSNLMDYKVAAKNNFSDVATGAWYADAVLKANAAGVLSGDGSGLASPSANITREQATSMLARAFAVADANGTSSSLTDTQNISSWARPAVFGMEAAGYVRGFEGKFNPKNNITRAEVITIINSAVKAYYTAAGTYTENVDGLAVVKVPGVVLKDVVISGNLIAAEGIASGDLTLDGKTEVKGKLIVRGGGENSIIIKGSAAVLSIEVSKVDGKVRIFADGALIKEITALKGEIILEGNFTNVEVKADATVIIKGNVGTLSMESKGTVDIQSGTVTTLDIPAGATATIAANATVTTANITGAADIKGTGAIGTANISGTGATIVQTPTAVNVADGGAATVGGKTVDGATSAAPSTGGGRGNSSNTVAVSAITVTSQGDATTVVNGKTLQMGVVVGPDNASNKKVTWFVTNDEGSATIDANGLLTATGVGKVTVKAAAQDGSGKENTKEITIHADLTAYNAALAAVKEADYTTDSWAIYQVVVAANVVTVINTQEEVTIATNNIIAAQANLVIPVTGISISGNGSVAKDDTLQLTATITPSNATNPDVTWSIETGGTGSATINTDGLLNPTSEGTVIVKVVSQYGTSITATKEITVTASKLDAAKANAKTELENYKVAANYTTNAAALSTAISNGKSAINSATNETEVAAALANAKTAIDGIKTDAEIAAEELAIAKATAKNDLDTYVDATDYIRNTAELNEAKLQGNNAIDNATDIVGVNTALANAKTAIDAIKSDKDLDDADIATAKANIEGASYTASQAEVSDEASALSKAKALVNALELKGTTATVVAGTLTEAVAGDSSTPAGTNGLYTFTVTIAKGAGTEGTTAEQTMSITATPYDSTAQDNTDISTAKTNIESATYTATQVEASDSAKALTKAQALVEALELKGTTATVVAGTFVEAITGTEASVNGTNGSFSFTVKIEKGLGTKVTTVEKTMTITATKYDPTADNTDIAAAKGAIEGATYETTQALVADKDAAKNKVQEIINGLATAETILEVVPGSFSGAIAGVAGVFDPTDGSYTFTVKINKGGGTEAITKELSLTITAETTTVTKASKVTVNGDKKLDSSKPYLVNGEPAASGNLEDTNCTAYFNSSTGVLTLKGYSGGSISTIFETTPDLIIKLIGSNVITTSYGNGIYNGESGNIYITSDSDATLEVNSSSDNSDVYAIATHDSSGKSIIIGGEAKVTVTAETTSPSRKSSVVTAGKDIIIQDDASLTGTSESIATGGYAIYANGKIVIDTTGNVDIDCSASSKSYAFNGMSGVDIKNVKLMTLKISEGGNYMSGTVDLSRVAVHKNGTDNIATYRGGVPYNLTLSNGQITAVKDLVIGTEIQYEYQGLENDEITIKAKEIANFAFVKWTNQDGTDLDSSLFVSSTDENSEATIKMPANNLNIKAQYKSTLFTTQPVFHRGDEKITWKISQAADYGYLQKKTGDNWGNTSISLPITLDGTATVQNNPGNHLVYAPDGTYRLKLTISSAPVGFRDHYSEEFVVQWKDTINIPEIPGVTAPVTGATPVTKITETTQYTGTVEWLPADTKFAGDTVYTAKITLKAKYGYKLDGVAANYFTVAGAATVTNAVDSGVITAVFPKTAAAPLGGTVSVDGTLKFGEVLTANTASLTGNTGDLKYAWKRDGVAIDGATASTYTTVKADINKTITVEVTSSVETGTVTGTASGIITKADGPDAPTVVGTANDADNEILVIGGEEKITVTIGKNMTGTYEYSVNGGTDWADLSAGDITGLTSATTSIQVREKATETVEAGSATTQSVTVTSIPVAVTGITVTGAGSATTIVTAEGTLQMSAAVLPEGATNKEVTWSVVDGTGKATINETGLLKATAGTASNGTVTVTATANDGSGITGTLVITISGQVDTVISIAAIQGVTAPVIGSTPVTTITETSQYTGTVVWSPTNDPFAGGTVYTATITLTAKTGFTLTGVAENSFTVAGADTVTNAVDSGVITAVFPATAAPDFALGSGTEVDPYQVSSAEELNKVRNHLDKHFKQTADINLSTYTADGGWQPIGDSSTPFKGTYDGDSKDITGLFINRPEADYQGLFGSTASAKVENCRISGSVKGKNYVGGLVGSNDGGTISSCYAPSVSITGKDSVGGLVGFVRSSSGALATIEKSYASGSVKGVINVGGLVGLHSMQGNNIGGSIKNSYTFVSVDATGSYVGGLIGNNKADFRYEETSIENCYSKGSVKSSLKGQVYIGGLVGCNNHNIKNSYAVGEVIVTNGEVDFIGGLIGWLMGGGKVTSSYYDSTTTGQSDTGKGVGKTTSEMKQAATFEGWDFETIWTIVEDSSYPTLE